MRNWILALFLAAFAASPAALADPASEIIGKWLFYKKIYQGQDMPEGPNANLRLHFDFSAGGESFLYWWHEGNSDHCARKAVYHVEGPYLVEEVVWVDPNNTMDCSSDPDMQPGKRTRTPIYFTGGDLVIRFQINGDSLDMVWKRIGNLPNTQP